MNPLQLVQIAESAPTKTTAGVVPHDPPPCGWLARETRRLRHTAHRHRVNLEPLRPGDLTEDFSGLQSPPSGSARRGPSRSLIAAPALAIALIAAVACTRVPEGSRVTVHAGGGDVAVTVELALTEAEQARGLMWRSELADGAGMLFVFDGEQERGFWMRNTAIPLDIIYIGADATIRSIAAQTKPYSEDTIPSRGPCSYVLEVPGGWARRHGVRSGDKLTLPDVAKVQAEAAP